MSLAATLAGLALIVVVLWDAFETIVLARRVSRRLRLARLFYRFTWRPFSAMARWLTAGNRRENYLSVYGPLSLILLLALWAFGLILAFALFHWGLGLEIRPEDEGTGLATHLYLSGTTFFTLGFGDVTPVSPMGRLLAVLEAGTGFGFLALVLGYLPVLSQAFSRREVDITLLDARAGSPPSAAELLRRHGSDHHGDALLQLLREWERWSAELLEIHVSFPVLAYFRSQHDNQSWVAALTTILDVCAVVIAGMEGSVVGQARLTFAMARHAVVDMASVFSRVPLPPEGDRLSPELLARLRQAVADSGARLRPGPACDHKLAELRGMYEPYVNALSLLLLMPLPPWVRPAEAMDNWQTTA